MNGWMAGWMGRQLDEPAGGPRDGRMKGAERWGWVSGPDGWMERPLDGRADGPTDG